MKKETTEDVHSIKMSFLRKHHDFQSGRNCYDRRLTWYRNDSETGRISYDLVFNDGYPEMIFDYKVRGWNENDWTDMKYSVRLDSVPCHIGGRRFYFLCPYLKNNQFNQVCGKRVAVLYSQNRYFCCRECANLTYEACQTSKRMRGYPWKVLTDSWKADKIYQSLKRTHYRGRLTKKYRKCLELWGDQNLVHHAEKQLLKEV